MKTRAAFLSATFALLIALFISGAWPVAAEEPANTALKPGAPVAQTVQPHYQSLMERLQKQWRVDPAVADAHNPATTGWETPACAPHPGKTGTAVGNGLDRTEKCVQACMKGTSMDNPNGILLCRSSCL